MRVWIDISAPAHVLVFRPILGLLREDGHEVEVTTRDYAQTLELLDQHGIEAEVVGRQGVGRVRGRHARSSRASAPSNASLGTASTTSRSRTAHTS